MKREKHKAVFYFLPALVVLLLGLVAIDSSVRLMDQYQGLETRYKELLNHHMETTENTVDSETENYDFKNMLDTTVKRKQWMYWSVVAMGLVGFVLVVMNADKMKRLETLNQEKKASLQLLEERLFTILKSDQEKKEMQDQLYQAQKMEAVGRLAGGIAHDFNNILAAMNGYAEFLIEDLESLPQQQGFAKNILQAGKQAKSLVDKILAFSRRSDSGIETVDLKTPLDETLSMLQASLPKSIQVKTAFDIKSAKIMGNGTQIAQVIMNLCVNASDAMEERNGKGALMIGLKAVEVSDVFSSDAFVDVLPDPKVMPPIRIESVSPDHTRLVLGRVVRDMPYCCLSIEDTGTGMSRLVMEHVFEPFFTTKPVDKGTGLGLSTVHGVIGGHRGALVLESKLGQGTGFYLYFPMSGGAEEGSQLGVEEFVSESGQGRILLVEDQIDVQIMTATMLKRLGYEVIMADDGLEASGMLKASPHICDLVLTDQNMPKMTGLELIADVKSSCPALPFVMLSGYSQEALEDFMEQDSAIKAILRKPVSQKMLGDVLSRVLQEALQKQKAA